MYFGKLFSAQLFFLKHDSTWHNMNHDAFYKKGDFKNFAKFTGKNLRQILTQVSSCEFCDVFKNTYFIE